MSFPRYERYKDSGIEWLGEVPEHWVVSALKHQIRMRYGDALASEVREDGDIEVFGSNGPVGLHCVSNTKSPAIVVGRKGSYGKIVWTERGGFVIDTAYAIDSDTTGLNLRWVYYGLQPLGLDSLSQDTGVPGLAREKAYEIQIAVPPHSEQSTIAAFLDRETAKTDALIAEQQRLIELLKEKRQAVISHAVTKGLNPDAPMKDSGIEWLGEVPEHWSVCALNYRFQVDLGKMLDEKRITGDHLSPYLRNTDVQWGAINTNELPEMDFHGNDLVRYGLKLGDLLVCEGGDVGRAAIWRGELEECYYQKALHRLRARTPETDVAEFFYFVLYSAATRGVFSESGKSTIAHLTADSFRRYRFPFPPHAEQIVIAAFLACETAKLDTLTTEAKTAIALLQERRTALISAAVTGKIDVRGLVEAQPDVEQAA